MYPLKIFASPFIKYKNQDITISMEFCCNSTAERGTLYKLNFLFFRFGKKEQSDLCRVMAEKTQHPVLLYITIQDPISCHVQGLNIENSEKD